jgi:hypothetical protein
MRLTFPLLGVRGPGVRGKKYPDSIRYRDINYYTLVTIVILLSATFSWPSF